MAVSGPPPDHGVVDFRADVPHPARIYDYWLGGKDNFAADREAAEAVIAIRPTVVRDIRANRAFMHRAVAWLVSEAGIGQFLDIGTGLPTKPNVHDVAQAVIPAARVVYADNDPLVLSHAQALLVGGPEGKTAYVDADLRDPDQILDQAARTLDFTRPVAVEPGVVQTHRWRPEPGISTEEYEVSAWAAIGRKS